MLKQDDIDKIERYKNGTADEAESNYVKSLLMDGVNNPYLRNYMKEEWNSLTCETTASGRELGHLLDKVHNLIAKKEKMQYQKSLRRIIQLYSRVAAILLIPLLIAGGYIFSSYLSNDGVQTGDQEVLTSIIAPLGSRVTFNLPDGTTGMLNGGAILSYSLPFVKNRQIKLEGEAWFEVKHDEKFPFEISSGNSIVRVLGTKFNISSYPQENFVEVVLNEGRIEVFNNVLEEKITMAPTERMVLHNGKTSLSFVDPEKYNAWTEGRLVFRGDYMPEVARRIERWYNVKIVLADSDLYKYSFRGTFEDDSLEEVLQFLCLTSPIRYKIAPRVLTEDGTLKKTQVTIYKLN